MIMATIIQLVVIAQFRLFKTQWGIPANLHILIETTANFKEQFRRTKEVIY